MAPDFYLRSKVLSCGVSDMLFKPAAIVSLLPMASMRGKRLKNAPLPKPAVPAGRTAGVIDEPLFVGLPTVADQATTADQTAPGLASIAARTASSLIKYEQRWQALLLRNKPLEDCDPVEIAKKLEDDARHELKVTAHGQMNTAIHVLATAWLRMHPWSLASDGEPGRMVVAKWIYDDDVEEVEKEFGKLRESGEIDFWNFKNHVLDFRWSLK